MDRQVSKNELVEGWEEGKPFLKTESTFLPKITKMQGIQLLKEIRNGSGSKRK
jgi:hypothetical protein